MCGGSSFFHSGSGALAIKALRNVAAMGPFSSDRTIGEHADKIWRSKPLELAK